jgi:hypothetical protein
MGFPSRRLAVALLAATVGGAREAHAQEFVQQTLLVAPLYSEGTTKEARQVATALRTRLAHLVSRRELEVVGTDTLEALLFNSGYRPDSALGESDTRDLARKMRADEVVRGSVIHHGSVIEVRLELRVTREWRWREPIRVVRATSMAAVADTLAGEIVRDRAQMAGLRRCENAASIGDLTGAAKVAERAIARDPVSTLTRTCLALVIRFNGVGADSLVRVTEAILAVDSTNIVAAVMRARNLEAVRSAGAAAEAWRSVIGLRPDSLELALEGVEELMRLQRPAMALDATRLLLGIHAPEPRLRRIAFRADVALGVWTDAAALGDSLDAEDPEFRDDSTYATRHIEALRVTGDSLGALAKSARTVRQHPGDLVVYLQYLKLVGSEQVAALPRGVARFPDASELRVMVARSALSTGKKGDARAALDVAVRLDTLLTQGFLQIAELWFDDSQPDSALATVARAPRTGTNAELLRTYAISRGRLAVQSATDSAPEGWRLGLALFALADSVESREDSRGLLAVTTLQFARAALVDASKSRDCQQASRANDLLGMTADELSRGVGESAGMTELRGAYDAMRTATDNAKRIYCTTPRASEPLWSVRNGRAPWPTTPPTRAA